MEEIKQLYYDFEEINPVLVKSILEYFNYDLQESFDNLTFYSQGMGLLNDY